MAGEPPPSDLSRLLRQLRDRAGLTQESLAERAKLSQRAISDLERGLHRTARRDTLRLLADALGLSGSERARFEAIGLGRSLTAFTDGDGPPPTAPGSSLGRSIAATRPSLPRDIGGFTGRQEELERLFRAVGRRGGVVDIYAIDGMAGVGKSAFAVHAAHRLKDQFPDGQIYLSLHAHTQGQHPVDPVDALASLLLTVGVPREAIPAELEGRSAMWRERLEGRRFLILLDDAAGHEQVRPLLPGTPGSLVLITSRSHLGALDGTGSLCLDTLPPGDAADLLVRLADRDDVRPDDPAVGQINELCGHLPLAIGLLARQLNHHRTWSAASLARYLSATRDRLAMMQVGDVSVTAAIAMSYADLSDRQRELFQLLGLHPGQETDPFAAAALADVSPAEARLLLNELFHHHLVTEPVPGRFGMHDLIREHVRALAEEVRQRDQDEALRRLVAYYVRATTAAGRFFNRQIGGGAVATDGLPDLNSAEAAAEWMEAERANVHAIVDLGERRTWARPGLAMVAATSGFLRLHGHWTQMRILHLTALRTARRAGYREGEVDVLTSLGVVQRLTGDYAQSTATLNAALSRASGLQDPRSRAAALVALGVVQRLTTDFGTATATLSEALEMYRQAGDATGEAEARNELGYISRQLGDYAGAATSHRAALAIYHAAAAPLGEADSLRYLSRARWEGLDRDGVLDDFRRALAIYQRLLDRVGQAHALSDLGAGLHDAGYSAEGDDALRKALAEYRRLGHQLGQAEVLVKMGNAHRARSPGWSADRYAEALAIAERLGALLEQARALEGIGELFQESGDAERATKTLRRAAEVYERLGSPRARVINVALAEP